MVIETEKENVQRNDQYKITINRKGITDIDPNDCNDSDGYWNEIEEEPAGTTDILSGAKLHYRTWSCLIVILFIRNLNQPLLHKIS